MTKLDVEQVALGLLARREHSQTELRRKLLDRGFDDEAVFACLAKLKAEGWQCDKRYAEVYVRVRSEKGYGPHHIDNSLRERGVSDDIRRVVLAPMQGQWAALACALRQKRFARAADWQTLQKQKAFLKRRGFDHAHITVAFEEENE